MVGLKLKLYGWHKVLVFPPASSFKGASFFMEKTISKLVVLSGEGEAVEEESRMEPLLHREERVGLCKAIVWG